LAVRAAQPDQLDAGARLLPLDDRAGKPLRGRRMAQGEAHVGPHDMGAEQLPGRDVGGEHAALAHDQHRLVDRAQQLGQARQLQILRFCGGRRAAAGALAEAGTSASAAMPASKASRAARPWCAEQEGDDEAHARNRGRRQDP
jgi:hypothetical protein